MSTNGSTQSGMGNWRLPFLLAVTVAFTALVAFISWNQLGDASVRIGADGASFDFERNDDFASIVSKTLAAEDGETRRAAMAVLREEGIVSLNGGEEDDLTVEQLRLHGYFRPADAALRDEFVRMDFDGSNQVQEMFLEMLWDLQGPFKNRTLHGAGEPFLAAFEELHSGIGKADSVPPLVEAMWRRQMDWVSPFQRHSFSANIEIRPSVRDSDQIYVCSGTTHLDGKYVRFSVRNPDDPAMIAPGTGPIERLVVVDQGRFPCDGGTSVSAMLASQPVRMAVGPDLARQILLPGEQAGPLPAARIEGEIVVRPRYLVSAAEISQ
jgi:hypothetical protein